MEFQLTRSRGAWRQQKSYVRLYQYFNSHAHVERDGVTCISCENVLDFNSHAHVERDAVCNNFIIKSYISTHTLTWSVTQWPCEAEWLLRFQLTRSRGAWLYSLILPIAYLKISTHTLTWSVTYICTKHFINFFISTHTLTWSVT